MTGAAWTTTAGVRLGKGDRVRFLAHTSDGEPHMLAGEVRDVTSSHAYVVVRFVTRPDARRGLSGAAELVFRIRIEKLTKIETRGRA